MERIWHRVTYIYLNADVYFKGQPKLYNKEQYELVLNLDSVF